MSAVIQKARSAVQWLAGSYDPNDPTAVAVETRRRLTFLAAAVSGAAMLIVSAPATDAILDHWPLGPKWTLVSTVPTTLVIVSAVAGLRERLKRRAFDRRRQEFYRLTASIRAAVYAPLVVEKSVVTVSRPDAKGSGVDLVLDESARGRFRTKLDSLSADLLELSVETTAAADRAAPSRVDISALEEAMRAVFAVAVEGAARASTHADTPEPHSPTPDSGPRSDPVVQEAVLRGLAKAV